MENDSNERDKYDAYMNRIIIATVIAMITSMLFMPFIILSISK